MPLMPLRNGATFLKVRLRLECVVLRMCRTGTVDPMTQNALSFTAVETVGDW
jgi:hypothetical protein